MEGKGQLELTNYATSQFWNGDTNINNALTYVLAVDNTGKVWKKEAEGGGTVLEVDTEGLITGGPITTTGTITTSMATSRLVGRWDTGTGIMQEIVIGSGLTLTGDTLTADGGTGFDVQVNDTTIIPPATILNLKSGTDIDVVYEGSGAVRFDFSGTPGGTYDSDQGIYKDTSLTNDTFMLGAPSRALSISHIPFTVDRFVYADFSGLTLEGQGADDHPGVLSVINTGSAGVALNIRQTTDGTGIKVTQTTGNDFQNGMSISADNTANSKGLSINDFLNNTNYTQLNLISQSTDTTPILIQRTPLGVADLVQRFMLLQTGQFPQISNMGGSIDFKIQTTTFVYQDSNKIITRWTDSTNATRTSQFEIQGVNSGAAIATQLTVKGTGQLQLNNYTTATAFDDDSGASIGVLNVDNLGNVFVGDGGGGPSPLTTKGDLYTFDTADTRLPVGLDTQVLLADSSTPTGLRWGTNTTPPASGYYGAFLDDTIQTAVSANTAYPVKFNTTDLSNGVTVVNDGSGNPTRVTLANTGIYNVQFSLQLEKTGGSGNFVVDIWLRKNGVDIPDTTGKVVLTGSASASPMVAAWNYLLDLAGGDYVQLMWSTTNNNAVIFAAVATPPHPGVPSSILTVTQQAGILAGTGITAINSLTGAVQTMGVGTGGTDFAIDSTGAAHTFNLPTANATNRGALSNTDWTRFDSFKTQSIGITVDGSGGTITVGQKGYVQIPYACTITGWRITTNATGTLVFDVDKAASGTIPTVSITGSAPPTLGGGQQTTFSSTLTGWTTTINANDMLGFTVDNAVTVSWAILQLFVTRT
jgi:hypothetical protein